MICKHYLSLKFQSFRADVSARPLDLSQSSRSLRRQKLWCWSAANQTGPTSFVALQEHCQPSVGSYFPRFNLAINPVLSLAWAGISLKKSGSSIPSASSNLSCTRESHTCFSRSDITFIVSSTSYFSNMSLPGSITQLHMCSLFKLYP